MAILDVQNLTFTYPECAAPALRDVSFTLADGDFAVLCGATGSGKSTLLRLLKRELAPRGTLEGNIRYRGTPVDALDAATAACSIGFVMQNPEHQIVTDKVWHELAFGPENLGWSQEQIARKCAEMASYFGIEHWYDRPVSTLSGGQKQLLNLAAVMVTDPGILILDEPCAQLDPIAAADFIATLKKLNRDFSLTIVIVEHRLEELIPICDRLIVLDHGALLADGAPTEVTAALADHPELLSAFPAAARIYHAVEAHGECPLTVRDGRRMLCAQFENTVRSLAASDTLQPAEAALELRGVYFRYGRDLPDVLCGLDLTVNRGEIFCILGGNGAGKSTALSLAAGFLRPYSGSVRIFGKKLKEYKNQSLFRECLAVLPQDVQTVFLKNTVAEELTDAHADPSDFPFDLSHLLDRHPYDLSGGEQQLVALAKALAAKPKLLLLDEPTKGLDAQKKQAFAEILRRLKADGVTVVIVTHDVEFTAECADRCALFFRGQMIAADEPTAFFAENRFYTTAACRMTKGFFDRAVTVAQVAALCAQNRRKGGQV
ncbi:MAG: ATP-binding cassette domain-containing protein [Clostridia bacterium]|nr:ATP-binding cassette domain-containing protein [Clostridia bacterium]